MARAEDTVEQRCHDLAIDRINDFYDNKKDEQAGI